MNAQDSVVVNHSEAEVGLDKFDPGKMIIDHISDAHSWHLWGHTEIPLPVIVYSKDRGLSVFLLLILSMVIKLTMVICSMRPTKLLQ